MTDQPLVYSRGASARNAHEARTAEAIGDGTTITGDDFARMDYAERCQLHTVNPAQYAKLQAEQDKPRFRK